MTAIRTRLDMHWVRAQFALPRDAAFFDNAGGSFTLHRVIARVTRYMLETPVQLGATHELSTRAGDRQHQSVAALAAMVGADPSEIVLGPSAGALIDRVARALRPSLCIGDEIVVTQFDHEANISPWLRLRDFGVNVRIWPLDRESGTARVEDLVSLLNPRTRLVACTHSTNVLGAIMPIREIIDRVHEAGAQILVDGVAYAPHRRLNLTELGADYYVMSLYKMFGPHIGLLYGQRDRLVDLANINLEPLTATSIPLKFQPGGVPYELAYGAAGIPDYLNELGRRINSESTDTLDTASQAIAEHESLLAQRFLDGAARLTRFRLYGPATGDSGERVPIFTFNMDGITARDVAAHLDRSGLYARSGHFNAQRLAPGLGFNPDEGAVRVSFAHYNTIEEVDRLVSALGRLQV